MCWIRVFFFQYDGHTALHISAWEGDEMLVKYLYQMKANPNLSDMVCIGYIIYLRDGFFSVCTGVFIIYNLTLSMEMKMEQHQWIEFWLWRLKSELYYKRILLIMHLRFLNLVSCDISCICFLGYRLHEWMNVLFFLSS